MSLKVKLLKERLAIWLFLAVALVFIPRPGVACSGKNMPVSGVHGCCHQAMQGDEAADKPVHDTNKKTVSHSSEDADCCDAHYHSAQSDTDEYPSNTPCSKSCCHGCHCSMTGVVQVLFTPSASISLPSYYKQQVKPRLLLIRLPSGFDFIWRPPKIGQA